MSVTKRARDVTATNLAKKLNKTQMYEVDSVLQKLRNLRNNPKKTSTKESEKISLPEDVLEVEDLQSEEVCNRIAELAASIVNQIMSSNSFEYVVPSRSSTNQKYIENVDRIVLGDKVSKRQFLNTAHVRKTAITTRVVQLVHEVLRKGIHITKRDLFCK